MKLKMDHIKNFPALTGRDFFIGKKPFLCYDVNKIFVYLGGEAFV